MSPRSTTLIPSSGSMTSLSASVTSSYFSGLSVAVVVIVLILRLNALGGLGSVDEVPVVALVLEAVGQFGAALLDDAAVDHHVHEVGTDIPQDARVVRDQQHTEVRRLLGAVHTLRDDLQR